MESINNTRKMASINHLAPWDLREFCRGANGLSTSFASQSTTAMPEDFPIPFTNQPCGGKYVEREGVVPAQVIWL
jgi:hypothetical protein